MIPFAPCQERFLTAAVRTFSILYMSKSDIQPISKRAERGPNVQFLPLVILGDIRQDAQTFDKFATVVGENPGIG